jgi:hypothetical protein
MATQSNVDLLQKGVATILGFDRNRLMKRVDWGTISFEKGEPDFQRIFGIADYLKLLPVEILTDETVNKIVQAIQQCVSIFNAINTFTLENSGTPASVRDQQLVTLKSVADNLFTQASPWIPFLAYQKGDVSKNIADLNSAATKAAGMIGEAQKEIAEKRKEIDVIIVQAREASVAAGAAVFTEDFSRQADTLEVQTTNWLRVTGILAGGALVASVWFFLLIKTGGDKLEIAQRITSKIVILGILLTATIWCGRIYKALKHQSSVYRFKALGLQTFRAFSAGTSDLATKDAVLMETTRSIFSAQDSGYIDQSDSGDSDVK